MRRLVPAVGLLLLWTSGPCLAATAPIAAAASFLERELEVRDLLAKGDRAALESFYKSPENPDALRASAFSALLRGRQPPLTATERAWLSSGLADRAPEVRLEAVRLAGEKAERGLEHDLLRLSAQDPDGMVRLAALKVVEPWTRITSLYFLEEALRSGSALVRAQGVRSIARLSYNELSPSIVANVKAMAGEGEDPRVRVAAWEALQAWGILRWENLHDAILDADAPEGLRARALELSDSFSGSIRQQALLEVLDTETSLPLVWRSFRRLRVIARNDKSLTLGAQHFLKATPEKNAATEEMAQYLRSLGIRTEYRSGAWSISGAER